MNREELSFYVRKLVRLCDGQTFSKLIASTPYIDVIDALEHCKVIEIVALLMKLTSFERAALFAYFPVQRQDVLLQEMSRKEAVDLFEHLPADDRADVFNRLSDDICQKLLPALAKSERDDILELAAFSEGTAGSVTTSDYTTLSSIMSVKQAFVALRSCASNRESIDVMFVLDSERRLLGSVTLRDLVLATPETLIGDLMTLDPVFARADSSGDLAAELIRRYDLLALPVLSEDDRMVGIITVDDAMDVEKQVDATQLARFGGTPALGGTDLDVLTSPFRKMFGVRVFWLAILTFFGIFISNFISAQEEMLSQIIILAAFIAPIIDMGGNTGSQSAALVIRSMALGDVRLKWRHIWLIIKRELPVAFALGVAIALLEVVLAYFSKGIGMEIMLVVGLSTMVCTAAGGMIGALLPFLARRIGTDPATLSSPMITSIMDMVGVMIYFGFAYLFLADQMVQTV
ncbi:magnesium transporter [Pseudomonas sp. TH49]|uniref:magnesium transporter n=1 Tax=Pseudomonas sp. TH49 TaxID=2796413 RepID=UPI001911ED86|nr:magnesium transporter [Pseudomonas sp. TH49]MBK5344730.1 magnesium transporter [Pseudomonas sp. TH49]